MNKKCSIENYLHSRKELDISIISTELYFLYFHSNRLNMVFKFFILRVNYIFAQNCSIASSYEKVQLSDPHWKKIILQSATS